MFLRMLLIFAALATLSAMTDPGDAKIEVKEDFIGQGDFSSYTNYGASEDRAYSLGEELEYGRILKISRQNTSLFSGFRSDLGSYFIASPEHQLRLSNIKNLSATSKIESQNYIAQGDFTANSSAESYTKFSASGEGMVREKVLSSGPKGRPIDLTSIYHAGVFQINSSTRFTS